MYFNAGSKFDRFAKISGRYKAHFLMGVVEIVGNPLFSSILFFNSLGWYMENIKSCFNCISVSIIAAYI